MESRREKDEIREKVWRVGERVEEMERKGRERRERGERKERERREIESRIKARERERD